MSIKAIETRYKGYRFRSRLEARWAVFFDAFPLRWEYEPEGYDLGAAGYYLPDFYLPDLDGGTYVEVKPDDGCLDGYEEKFLTLTEQTGKNLLLAVGTPDQKSYPFFQPPGRDEGRIHEACFQKKYLPPRLHDGKPRLFIYPGDIECDADCHGEIGAARSARFEHGETPK
jgi:hypothetical protein